MTCSVSGVDIYSEEGVLVMSETDLDTLVTFTGVKQPASDVGLPRLVLRDNGGWNYSIPYTDLKAVTKSTPPDITTS